MYFRIAILLLLSYSAYAYVDPSFGAGIIALIVGIVGSLLLASITNSYYPIKRFFRNRKMSIGTAMYSKGTVK